MDIMCHVACPCGSDCVSQCLCGGVDWKLEAWKGNEWQALLGSIGWLFAHSNWTLMSRDV